jgi:phosphoesterase RecJ-like protein
VSVATETDQLADELRGAEKLLLTTHENPDGDALGSLLGAQEMLRAMGKDAVMFMSADQFPLPHEYRHMPLGAVVEELPADVSDRVLLFLDCGNIDRMPVDFAGAGSMRILNVDHHHDNTRFGHVNLVDPDASCTAEIVWRLARELDVELTPALAKPLYIGLITDTGRFMYENTTPQAHEMAAECIEAGVEVHDTYRSLYEDLPFSRLQLLARALNRVRCVDVDGARDTGAAGALCLADLTREDFESTGSTESDSEGIVDHLRAVQGALVAGLVRELLAEDRRGLRKVSLRSVNGGIDVSRIARGMGGGGHRQAAGFTTELDLEPLVERLRAEIAAQL